MQVLQPSVAFQCFKCVVYRSLCRFISPLLLFRWMFLLLLSSMPWFWFIGLRKLGMNRLEATMAALCVHSICSWRKFGLELDAFQEYGIFTQAYGMAIFPLAGNHPCLVLSLIHTCVFNCPFLFGRKRSQIFFVTEHERFHIVFACPQQYVSV